MESGISPALAVTPQGRAFYCACKDQVNLSFKDRWFRFGRADLPGFRDWLQALLGDADLVRRLLRQASEEAAARGMPPDGLPSREDLEEMFALIDTSVLILEAQEIAGAGRG